jgi:uncharacterized protein (DUF1697 family)
VHTYVSLLRGINVGGHKPIRMEELRGIYAAAGMTQVKSYLQSGNVVFDSPDADRSSIAAKLEAAIAAAYGYPVTVMLRTPADMQRILTGNPFLEAHGAETAKLHVVFLAAAPSKADAAALADLPGEPEELSVAGEEVYVYYPNGAGRSKLTNAFFEKKLRTAATARNWNTIVALHKLTHPD